MARQQNRISSASLRAIKPGKHCDGGGLWLLVDANGSGRWTFRYMQRGRARERGLGSYPALSLAAARVKAGECRAQLVLGLDPIEEARKLQEIPTFGVFALETVAAVETKWRNLKHRAQWRSTLEEYAAPLWKLKVNEIRADDVRRCLQPIWSVKRETASRVRGRIEFVLDRAEAKGFRSGDNPARWKGNLRHLLDGDGRKPHRHHPALPYKQAQAFYSDLVSRDAMAAQARACLILTAARSGEVLGATWPEFDLAEKLWVIPGERMKAKKEHRVPLSEPAMAILEKLKPLAKGKDGALVGPVFPSSQRHKPLSNMALAMLLRRMNDGDTGPIWVDSAKQPITPHGFRSSFRDWCGEETTFSRDLVERCLAHTIGNEVERAYWRADAIPQRRKILDAWASYVTKAPGAAASNVRELKKAIG